MGNIDFSLRRLYFSFADLQFFVIDTKKVTKKKSRRNTASALMAYTLPAVFSCPRAWNVVSYFKLLIIN